MVRNDIIEVVDTAVLPESLHDVFHVWDALPKVDKCPLSSDFHLENVPTRILPWSVMVDVMPEFGQYKFRFWGTERVNLVGEELTGKRLTQLSNTYMRERNEEEYNYVSENGHAVLCHTPYTTPSGLISMRYSLRLPLTDNSGTVTRIFSSMDPDSVTEQDYQYYGTSPYNGYR